MKLFLKKLYKALYLWAVGGLLYCIFEMMFRGHTHWTMGVVGGFCFVMCGLLNEHIGWDMPLPLQMLIGCLIITGTELIAGVILNIWLGLNIWDYSNMPLNLWGQRSRITICSRKDRQINDKVANYRAPMVAYHRSQDDPEWT